MRVVWGAAALLAVLAIVAIQSRNQVEAIGKPIKVPMPDGSTQSLQPGQIEQQYKKALEDAMNTSRARTTDE